MSTEWPPEENLRLYLVHFQFGKEEPLTARLREAVPEIQKTLHRISKGKSQLAYRSNEGDTFGFLVKTTVRAGTIMRQIHSPGPSDLDCILNRAKRDEPMVPSPTRSGDRTLVVELASDHALTGYTGLVNWLGLFSPF